MSMTSFHKNDLAKELKRQVESMDTTMRKMGFNRTPDGHYHDEFYHPSGVRVKVIPIREKVYLSTYSGFKLKVEYGVYRRHQRNSVMVGIDNLKAVQKAVDETVTYKKEQAECQRLNKDFKEKLVEAIKDKFPGRNPDIYEGQAEFTISVLSGATDKPSINIKLHRGGQVSRVEVSYPKKSLDEIIKLLEAW